MRILQCSRSVIAILRGEFRPPPPTLRGQCLPLISLTLVEILATGLPAHHMQVIGSNKHNRFRTIYFKFLGSKDKGKVKFLVSSLSRLGLEAYAVNYFYFILSAKSYSKSHFLCEILLCFLRLSQFFLPLTSSNL